MFKKENSSRIGRFFVALALCLSLCLPSSAVYAAEKAGATIWKVVLHKKNGDVWKTLRVRDGKVLKLPNMANKEGYTFMGWSEHRGQSAAPMYEAKERLRVRRNYNLHAVVFDRKSERDCTEHQIIKPDLKKYSQVIFVGDSRTAALQTAFGLEFGGLPEGVSVIAKGGQGLHWMRYTAEKELLKAIDEKSGSGSTAVVFNLGVNDLRKKDAYIRYMNRLGMVLKVKGCELFYMSVNPVNSAMRYGGGKNERAIRVFNSNLKKNLQPYFTYIDCYQHLMKTGYSTKCGMGTEDRYDDGLHYDTATCKRIYNYCMKKINAF